MERTAIWWLAVFVSVMMYGKKKKPGSCWGSMLSLFLKFWWYGHHLKRRNMNINRWLENINNFWWLGTESDLISSYLLCNSWYSVSSSLCYSSHVCDFFSEKEVIVSNLHLVMYQAKQPLTVWFCYLNLSRITTRLWYLGSVDGISMCHVQVH